MGIKVVINYDELSSKVKKFRDEGEDIVQMRSTLRDRVNDLRKEWIGEAADKFFDEMENDLLPALARLAGALFLTQDVLLEVIKTIQTFDEETASYFKGDLIPINAINLGAFLSGAGVAAGIGSALDGSLSRGISGVAATQPFEEKPSEAGINSNSGGTGVGSSQGLQGDLHTMGAGVVDQVGSSGVGGIGSTQGGTTIPDHLYNDSSGSGAEAGSNPAQTSPGTVFADMQAQASAGEAPIEASNAEVAAAAGVAAAAAVAGASMSVKNKAGKQEK